MQCYSSLVTSQTFSDQKLGFTSFEIYWAKTTCQLNFDQETEEDLQPRKKIRGEAFKYGCTTCTLNISLIFSQEHCPIYPRLIGHFANS